MYNSGLKDLLVLTVLNPNIYSEDKLSTQFREINLREKILQKS